MVISLTATPATQNRPGTISYDYMDGTHAHKYISTSVPGEWVAVPSLLQSLLKHSLKEHPDFAEKFSLWA